ncbi:MAG TPA: TetR/AcrR family transcriptional regulator [Spirochaetota bacterium]|nr:TetR/AcrR family transcriptional regulator [Spirochaetota bacterium]HOD14423.1 TetR/AcrR family transcriptional regulator [Spirochaetota bacterium]HPG52070.1 TetR/AcrR family transcriptional regulator [Spirochaetota bacterium]HPN13615.1 TetR/AcrR family transcriptional regulator [Spirochaetota bacterium]HQL81950.1 TetR/AcrR family transcriptional regulator [Spirochaetota bacterium]
MTLIKKRAPTALRKEQIIGAAMSLIAEQGLAGASMGRIAEIVGISEPAIYRHFGSRREILLAALDAVSVRLISLYVPQGDAVTRLRRTSEAFYNFVMDHPEDSRVLFEFICASPAEDLRDTVQQKMLLIISMARALIEEGVREGSLQKNLDIDTTAWEIFSHGFTLNFASLLGFSGQLTKKRAMSIIDVILERIRK